MTQDKPTAAWSSEEEGEARQLQFWHPVLGRLRSMRPELRLGLGLVVGKQEPGGRACNRSGLSGVRDELASGPVI